MREINKIREAIDASDEDMQPDEFAFIDIPPIVH